MSSEPSGSASACKNGTPTKKRPRKRLVRDANAPAQPKSGYMRFMMVRRPQLVMENPTASNIEICKLLGSEWRSLSSETKEAYMQAAAVDKEQYNKELAAYKKTDAYKQFKKKLKKYDEGQVDELVDHDGSDIPIFSKEFLEHNRKREAELRQLRSEAVRLDEEKGALDDNIGRLKKAIDQLEKQTNEQRQLTELVHSHLQTYRQTLIQAFAHMPFPGTNMVPTIGTIDNYMSNIHKLVLEAPGEHQDFVAKVRDIVTKLRMPATNDSSE